jgi:hypothetical protein
MKTLMKSLAVAAMSIAFLSNASAATITSKLGCENGRDMKCHVITIEGQIEE